MSRSEQPYVLVVDDNEATCTLVTALLRREFAVDVAADGLEAVEKLRTNRYAAVLLDLKMPQLDGYGVLDFVKEHAPEMLKRILILTASLTPREVARVKEYEVCGVIAKPFEVESLLAAVRQCAQGDGTPFRPILATGMILLLADFLRKGL